MGSPRIGGQSFLLSPKQAVPGGQHTPAQFFFIPIVLTLTVFTSVCLIVRFDCMLKFKGVSSMCIG